MVSKILCEGNINPGIRAMSTTTAANHPVVGRRAKEIAVELQSGIFKPFSEVVNVDVGDSQAAGQEPFTFPRQVVALLSHPELLESPGFHEDAKTRARAFLKAARGSVGCYSDPEGLHLLHCSVARYIEARDGVPSSDTDILICAGVTKGLRTCLEILDSGGEKRTGVMVPVPRYPPYATLVAERNMHQIDYYLNEDNNWGIEIVELERAIKEARNHCLPRAIIINNPGNPTGHVLSRKTIEALVRFAHKEKLFILADEVYQDIINAEDVQFHSIKKILSQMGDPYNTMELASFHSCSASYLGECGLRAAFAEIINLDPEVRIKFRGLVNGTASVDQLGQAVLEVLLNPPQPGDPSYGQFKREKDAVLDSLKEKAAIMTEELNKIPGFECNPIQGAVYVFPKIALPPKAVEKARKRGQPPDLYYALQLLEHTGICCVPGSDFGQKLGTFHIRISILPSLAKLREVLEKLRSFQEQFLSEYL